MRPHNQPQQRAHAVLFSQSEAAFGTAILPLVSSAPQACVLTGFSESMVWAKCQVGGANFDEGFPQPMRNYGGTTRTVWLTEDLVNWVRNQADLALASRALTLSKKKKVEGQLLVDDSMQAVNEGGAS